MVVVIALAVVLGLAAALRIQARVFVGFGLLALLATGVVLPLGARQVADQLAATAYFCLAMAVALAGLEILRIGWIESKKDEE